MSENIENNTQVKEETADETKQPDVKQLVDQEVSKAISNIKLNLDNAYKERDEALSQIEKIKVEKRQAEISSLEQQGKHSEAMQMKLNEMNTKLEAYEQKNIELSRDNAVRTQLNSLNFKSEKAANMAYSDIVKSLKKDALGNWVNENGASIDETVSNYAKDDNNEFLFSVKANMGSGITPAKPSTGTTPVSSIKDMTTDEMLNAVSKGQIKVAGDWSQ
jgi:vacuolar-type H+-ATPase subunit I/STV1